MKPIKLSELSQEDTTFPCVFTRESLKDLSIPKSGQEKRRERRKQKRKKELLTNNILTIKN